MLSWNWALSSNSGPENDLIRLRRRGILWIGGVPSNILRLQGFLSHFGAATEMNLGQMLSAIRESQVRQREAEAERRLAEKIARDRALIEQLRGGFEEMKLAVDHMIRTRAMTWDETYNGIGISVPDIVRQQLPYMDLPLNKHVRDEFEVWLNHNGLASEIVNGRVLVIRPLI